MYYRVGTYAGRVPLQELADRLGQFEIAWAPTDYGTTVDHFVAVREGFSADLQDALPGVWASSMLVVIRPEGHIRKHTDILDKGERYHLVLQTNEDCWNYHDGDWQQLEAGGIYTVDQSKQHFSINMGHELRIHLVVDLEAAEAGAAKALDAPALV